MMTMRISAPATGTDTGTTAAILVTALAPAIWGSTYYVTTAFLPGVPPLTVAMMRALPAGLLLLAFTRTLPHGIWWGRALILGALNFAFFWAMLFVSAYRLPGGVAATVGAVQPLIVIALARLVLGRAVRPLAIAAGLAGIAGIALLVLTPSATLDPIGVLAGVAGAASMAFGTVLARRWQPPVGQIAFTAWQLTAGGILLIPAVLWFDPAPPPVTAANVMGIAWLSLVGAALTCVLWFRGLARLEPGAAASLGFLSPFVATLLGWLLAGQSLTPPQIAGFVIVIVSVWLSQRAARG